MGTGTKGDTVRILIACEFSEIVKEQLLIRGHDAHSCDLLPGEKGLPNHHQCDVRDLLNDGWDLMIAHPPCTHLAVSGARWFKGKEHLIIDAKEFFLELVNSKIPRVAVENPVSIMSTCYRKPDQIIQPWMFGHGETKMTCLWLKRLPKLVPTNIVDGREGRVWKEPPGPERWKNRSRTYLGIAQAMAEQWGYLDES